MNTIVNKPWGTYQVLDQGKNYFYLHTGLPRWHEWLINDIKKS